MVDASTSNPATMRTTRDPAYINRRFIYGMQLVGRATVDKDARKLDEGIEAVMEAIALLPVNGTFEHRWKWINTLGMALMVRLERKNDSKDLENAIVQFREALSLCPLDHAGRIHILAPLSKGLQIQAQRTGDVQSLKLTLQFCQELAKLRPISDPQRGETLELLGGLYYQLFERDRALENIDGAASALREAISLYPETGTSRFVITSKLGTILCARSSSSMESKDVDEGMLLLRESVASCPPDHPERSTCLHNLAVGLLLRASRFSRDIDDANEALQIEQSALDLHPPQGVRRAIIQKLSQVPAIRSELLEGMRIRTLNEAIQQAREVLDREVGVEGDARAQLLSDLGNHLHLRYVQLHREDDLTFAFGMHNQALRLRPSGHPARWLSLAALGIMRSEAASVDSHQPLFYINPAINEFRQALQCCPNPKDPQVFNMLLPNLARLLKARSDALDTIEDLDESIRLYKEILSSLEHDYPRDLDSCMLFYQAAESFRTRFIRDKTTYQHDLEEAVRLGEEARRLVAPEHMYYTFVLAGLADTYSELDSPPQDPFALYREAATHQMSPARFRLGVALNHWARHARTRDKNSATDAFCVALPLLDRCLTSRPTVQMQYEFLKWTPRFVPDACATAIEAGRLETALELLEHGRGLLWARLTRFRPPLHMLRDIDSRLASELEASSKELERLATSMSSSPAAQLVDLNSTARLLPFEQQVQQLQVASQRWEKVIRQIRLQGGEFSHFLESIPFSELQKAARNGPIIVVNVCDCHTDAIIVRDASPPVLVPLPHAEYDGLVSLAKTLAGSLQWLHARGGSRTAASRGQEPSAEYDLSDFIQRFSDIKLERGFDVSPARSESSARSEIREVLRSLWERVVEPIAQKLKELGVEPLSRVWWYPTSFLWRLPLHAAGPFKSGQPNFHDLYISSYMSTFTRMLSSELTSRTRNSIPPDILVVGAPGDPSVSTYLPDVEEEICRILEHSSSGTLSSMHVLVGEGATPEDTLRQLENTSWAHFTCHGFQKRSPFDSYFQLHDDKPLALKDLMQARLPKAELAFLSACNTATGDAIHDEVIHLAAAMQFCGFQSVIGTLWPMLDEDGPVVAEDFYTFMLNPPNGVIDFRNSAQALHHAVDRLRKNKVPVERWVNFVHYGF